MIKKYHTYSITSIFCGLLISVSVFSQQKNDLPSVKYGLDAASIPVFNLPFVNNDSLIQADNTEESNLPFRIARLLDVNIGWNVVGKIDTVEFGDRVWRIKIASHNAKALTLLFDDFFITPESELFIYSSDTSTILGPFTIADSYTGNFSIPPMEGKSIILELYQPNDVEIQSRLHIFKVGHVYKEINEEQKAGSSACNNNVACPEGTGWEDQIRSVAKLIFYDDNNSGWLCSGMMINNTANAGVPNLLTAFHCIDIKDVNLAAAGTQTDCQIDNDEKFWLQYANILFNYQATYCNGITGSTNDFVTGAKFLAASKESDYALLRLLIMPKESFNVYLAGWDRSGNIPQTGVGIHHPTGDIKKISVENDPVLLSKWTWPVCPGEEEYFWKVRWNNISTEHNGITEGGSSGSPFFNHSGLCVGQLKGGDNNLQYPCSNPTGFSYYGKISDSWNLGFGALSDYLDSIEFGAVSIPGININGTPEMFCNNGLWDTNLGEEGSDCGGPCPNPCMVPPEDIVSCQWDLLNIDPGANKQCTFCNGNATISGKNWSDKNKTKRANNSIVADNITIQNGSNIRFEAYSSIVLKAPFSVDESSVFVAVLGDCFCTCPWWCGWLFCTGYVEKMANDEIDNDGEDEYDNNNSDTTPSIKTLIKSKIVIFPNPSSNGVFTIRGVSRLSRITIMTILGEEIYSSSILNPNFNIDISARPKCIYFVKITNGEEFIVQKIVYQ